MPSATLGVAKALRPVFDAMGFVAVVAARFSVDRLAEHLIMPSQTLDVIGRLNQESKQIQKCRGVLGLGIKRVEVWPLDFDSVAAEPTPFPVETETLPAVADGGPDLAP